MFSQFPTCHIVVTFKHDHSSTEYYYMLLAQEPPELQRHKF